MTAVLERPAVRRLLEQELARRELAEFCALVDPQYQTAPHIARLCRELEAIDARENDRLIVMLPPRHSKTLHTSERFPAWLLGRNPRRQVILASYAAELAWQSSRRARDLFSHPRWPFAARLRADSHAMNRWETTDGGIVLAAGVGGAITGWGADYLLIDDFVRNRQDADSELIRQNQWDWFQSTARTRLMPGGAVVACATHWHEDDLIGRILNGQGSARWRVLRLPAIAEDDDPLGRRPGAALWPAWYDDAALADIKQDIGSREWAALYQQRPSAGTGSLFKRSWMQRRGMLPTPALRVVAVDAAFKTGVGNDYSAIAVWEADGLDYGLLGLERGRWEYPDLRAQVLAVADEAAPHAVLIEDTASGQSVIQELARTTALPIVPVKVTASKEARAAAVTPLFEAGTVVLGSDIPLLGDWIEEHVAFPRGRHDDLVDTTSMALGYLRDMVALMLARQRGPTIRPMALR